MSQQDKERKVIYSSHDEGFTQKIKRMMQNLMIDIKKNGIRKTFPKIVTNTLKVLQKILTITFQTFREIVTKSLPTYMKGCLISLVCFSLPFLSLALFTDSPKIQKAVLYASGFICLYGGLFMIPCLPSRISKEQRKETEKIVKNITIKYPGKIFPRFNGRKISRKEWLLFSERNTVLTMILNMICFEGFFLAAFLPYVIRGETTEVTLYDLLLCFGMMIAFPTFAIFSWGFFVGKERLKEFMIFYSTENGDSRTLFMYLYIPTTILTVAHFFLIYVH